MGKITLFIYGYAFIIVGSMTLFTFPQDKQLWSLYTLIIGSVMQFIAFSITLKSESKVIGN